MKSTNSTTRTLALLSALVVLQGCSQNQQENVFYDPWDQYELGKVYDCGDIQQPDYRLNTENSATPGFGCAHQSNMTVMVDDPADLTRQRVMTPADEVARVRVLQAYRTGRRTDTAPTARGTRELID